MFICKADFFIYNKSFLTITFHANSEGKGFVVVLHFGKGRVYVIKGILCGIFPFYKLYCTLLKIINNHTQKYAYFCFLWALLILPQEGINDSNGTQIARSSFYTERKYSINIQYRGAKTLINSFIVFTLVDGNR